MIKIRKSCNLTRIIRHAIQAFGNSSWSVARVGLSREVRGWVGGTSQSSSTGILFPEVQPLSLLYTTLTETGSILVSGQLRTYPSSNQTCYNKLISNGNTTEWSPIRSVIIRVITKSDDRVGGVRFGYHEYGYRQNWTTRSLITN